MKKLIFLGALAAAGLAVDVGAKSYAQSELEARARAEGAASASADIDSFPFVGKLLLAGQAGDITFSLRDVTTERVTFSTVVLALSDVKLDKGKLFDRKVEITDIDKGTITVGFSAAELGKRLGGLPVTIDDGRVSVTVAGQVVAATPSVTAEGSIRLTAAAGVPGAPTFNVPIPQTRLVNCRVSRVKVEDGVLEASCDINEIPPALLRAAQRVGAD